MTYADIQARIADELNRSDLTSQIQKAIISAVKHYDEDRTWFNEERATALTVASQNYVGVPSDFISEDKLQITIGSVLYTLLKIPYDEWAVKSAFTTSGQPTEYAYYQDRFYLYPTPGSAYTLTISYVKILTELSAGTDTNGWVDAEEMIRSRAMADVKINVLHDMPARAEAGSLAKTGCYAITEYSAMQRFLARRDTKVMTGKLKASYL